MYLVHNIFIIANLGVLAHYWAAFASSASSPPLHRGGRGVVGTHTHRHKEDSKSMSSSKQSNWRALQGETGTWLRKNKINKPGNASSGSLLFFQLTVWLSAPNCKSAQTPWQSAPRRRPMRRQCRADPSARLRLNL
jgi:hypothetical protein